MRVWLKCIIVPNLVKIGKQLQRYCEFSIFFNMAAVRRLGFVRPILGPPLKVLGLYHLSKLAWNQVHLVVFITV